MQLNYASFNATHNYLMYEIYIYIYIYHLATSQLTSITDILTTPENTITYHNALSLSPQNFA